MSTYAFDGPALAAALARDRQRQRPGRVLPHRRDRRDRPPRAWWGRSPAPIPPRCRGSTPSTNWRPSNAVMRRSDPGRVDGDGVWMQDPARTYVDAGGDPGAGRPPLRRRPPGGRHPVAAGAVVGPGCLCRRQHHRCRVPGSGTRCCGRPRSARTPRSVPTPASVPAPCMEAGSKVGHLRRDQGHHHRARAARCRTSPTWATPPSARTATSAPAPSPATTTDTTSTAP